MRALECSKGYLKLMSDPKTNFVDSFNSDNHSVAYFGLCLDFYHHCSIPFDYLLKLIYNYIFDHKF